MCSNTAPAVEASGERSETATAYGVSPSRTAKQRAMSLALSRNGSASTAWMPTARLAALVPRPRAHLVTYHGLFAPAAPLRSRVGRAAALRVPHRHVPVREPRSARHSAASASASAGKQAPAAGPGPMTSDTPSLRRWRAA